MNRSQNASRYGRLAEEFTARRYGLGLDHSEIDGVRVDARDEQGRPWEVKSAMSNRKSSPSRFRLWEGQHEVLETNSGGYVFAFYKAVDDGIRVFNSRSVLASSARVDWGGSGDHYRGSDQAKIRVNSVFNQFS